MSTLEQLYGQAKARGTENRLPYAGAIMPAEAFELLQLDPHVRLVDVRTRAELDWVGRPAIDGAQYAHVEWIRYPGSVPNAEFIEQLRQVATPGHAGSVPLPQRGALEARGDCRADRKASRRLSTCWKASKATRTVRDIARRFRAGASAACRGSAPERVGLGTRLHAAAPDCVFHHFAAEERARLRAARRTPRSPSPARPSHPDRCARAHRSRRAPDRRRSAG